MNEKKKNETPSIEKSESPTEPTSPPKKKRGRPRKNPPSEPKPKRPRGRPRKEAPSPDAPAPEISIPEGVGRSAVEFAESVMWALENVNRPRMTMQRAKTKLRYALWEIGRENAKALAFQLAPRAMDIINKASAKQAEDAMVTAEEAAVAEIDDLLKDAIEEAKG